MTKNNDQPREYDLVLGGNNSPPVNGLVLGGISGVTRRLASKDLNVRILALKDALQYQEEGLNLVIQALQDESRQVQLLAYQLLRDREEKIAKEAVANYQPWNLRERFQQYAGYKDQHATVFANRRVENFSIYTGITDTVNVAYSFRYSWQEKADITTKFNRLLEDSQRDKVEALIFGRDDNLYSEELSELIINLLLNNKDQLQNLKAIFIGDLHRIDSEISWIRQGNITPVLNAYPNLEILQLRVGESGAFFSPTQHQNLKLLIIESSGISTDNLKIICDLNLPALEHLELWLGTPDYGGDSSIEDLQPILFDNLFPNLVYLGLRNSEYTNEIVQVLVNTPILNSISILDISMGILTDEGAEILLSCSTIKQLKILNVAENSLSQEMINKLQKLEIEVISDNQKTEENSRFYGYEYYRYCSVTE